MFVPQPHAAEPFPAAPTRPPVPAPRPTLSRETDEVELLVTAPNGDERSTSGYLAIVDGRAYLRPRGGHRCDWMRATAAGSSISVVVESTPVPTALRPVHDAEVQRRVSEELLARFGYDPAMPSLLDDASVSRTMELIPESASSVRVLAA